MSFLIAFVLSACSWEVHIRLSTSFDLASPLFLSGIDYAMLSLSMLHVFHSFVLLYSSNQSLFLVVTLQLPPSEVSLGTTKEVRSLQFNTGFDTEQPSTSLACTTCQQKSVGVNVYAYSTVFAFFSQFYPTLPYSS